MDNFKFEIKEKIGVLSTSKSGWSKELNLISWNDKEAKYDIREWNPEHDKMEKGVTFTKEELFELKEILDEKFKPLIADKIENNTDEKKEGVIRGNNDNEDNYDDDDEFEEAEDTTKSQDDIFEGVSLDDPVRMYLKEIGQYSILSPEREKKLAKEKQDAQALLRKKKLDDQLPIDPTIAIKLNADELKIVERGEVAQEVLIKCNLRLVVSIAKRYIGRGLSLLDLIQEGNIGLVRGIEKFDYKIGFKLSTYVTWWIRQAVSRAIADQSKTIRIPVYMVEAINRLNKERKKLALELGYEPSTKQLAKAMKMSEEKVEEAIQIAMDPISLDKPIGESNGYDREKIKEYDECIDYLEEKLGREPSIVEVAEEMGIDESEVKFIMDAINNIDDSTIANFISDPNAIDPEKNAERIMLKEKIQGILATLKDRERRVLELRFGINDDHPRTLEEIGKELKVTRERIRQIEDNALRKLKIRARNLQDIVK